MLPQEHKKSLARKETDNTLVQRKEVQGNSYTGYSYTEAGGRRVLTEEEEQEAGEAADAADLLLGPAGGGLLLARAEEGLVLRGWCRLPDHLS